MKRLLGTVVIISAITALIAVAAWRVAVDRTVPATVEVTGRVCVNECTVTVPLLRSDTPGETAIPGRPIVAGRLAVVNVVTGDHVVAGDVIAAFDSAPMEAALSLAQASAAEASATVALLGEKADDAAAGRDEVDAKRIEIRTTLVELKTNRADVAANLAQARELASSLPTTSSVPPTAPAGSAPRDPRAIVAQLEQALAKLDAGIAKAEAGLVKLDQARATIADALVVLADTRNAAEFAATGAQAGVALAEARLDLTVVRSPVDGIIANGPAVGTTVYAGAPLVLIYPDADTFVEAYVTGPDAALLTMGAPVTVEADYLQDPLGGTVTEVGTEYVYPPTAQAARDIHMVRGVRVRIRVDGDGLPPGAPVSIVVSTGR